MLKWALIFFVISIIAGLLGFTGIAAGAAGIAKILFVLFGVVRRLSRSRHRRGEETDVITCRRAVRQPRSAPR